MFALCFVELLAMQVDVESEGRRYYIYFYNSDYHGADRAGVSQSVAMALSGHKTASVYRRYRIVAEDDLRDALARMQASLTAKPAGVVTRLRDAGERAIR